MSPNSDLSDNMDHAVGLLGVDVAVSDPNSHTDTGIDHTVPSISELRERYSWFYEKIVSMAGLNNATPHEIAAAFHSHDIVMKALATLNTRILVSIHLIVMGSISRYMHLLGPPARHQQVLDLEDPNSCAAAERDFKFELDQIEKNSRDHHTITTSGQLATNILDTEVLSALIENLRHCDGEEVYDLSQLIDEIRKAAKRLREQVNHEMRNWWTAAFDHDHLAYS